jgi:hypothetical protein
VREHLRVDGRGASVFVDIGGQVERYCEGMVCRRVVVLCLYQLSCIRSTRITRSTRSIGFPLRAGRASDTHVGKIRAQLLQVPALAPVSLPA